MFFLRQLCEGFVNIMGKLTPSVASSQPARRKVFNPPEAQGWRGARARRYSAPSIDAPKGNSMRYVLARDCANFFDRHRA
jgi:hypothetical protein